MNRNRHRAGLMAGVLTLAAGLSGAGASHAAAFVSATGLTVAVDAQSVLRTSQFSFSQGTPFSDVENRVFRQSTIDGGAKTNLEGGSTLTADFNQVDSFVGATGIRFGTGEIGTSTVAGFAQVGLHDALTITGTPTTPDQLVLHRLLHVSGSASASEFLEFNGDNINSAASIKLISNGIDDGGLNPFLAFSFASVNDAVSTQGNDAFDRILDYAVNVNLNGVTDVDVALLSQFEFHMTDVDGTAPRGNFNLQGSVVASAFARFVGGATVTDTAGHALCGVTVTAESGADWGSIPACQGGGDGGGGAGGVPEPATWALMIAGFGGVGAALRRRRGLAAPAGGVAWAGWAG